MYTFYLLALILQNFQGFLGIFRIIIQLFGIFSFYLVQKFFDVVIPKTPTPLTLFNIVIWWPPPPLKRSDVFYGRPLTWCDSAVLHFQVGAEETIFDKEPLRLTLSMSLKSSQHCSRRALSIASGYWPK